MADKILKITTPDQRVHFMPSINKASVEHQNNLKPAHKRSLIEVVDAEEETKHDGRKNTSYIPGPAGELAKTQIDAANARIAELEKQLADAQGYAASTTAGKSVEGQAVGAIATIATLTTVAEVKTYTEGDTRKTVVDAANARIAELEK